MEAPIRRSQEDWDRFFMGMARHAATMSKDPDRKVGAVLVTPDRRQVSFGYNGFPAEHADLPRLLADRAYKRDKMVHAEANCLRQAPFYPADCTLYVTRFPCLGCAAEVKLRRVSRVVAPLPDLGHARWGESWRMAGLLLIEAGIQLATVPVED